ncbi:cell division protein ZapA [Serpentinicella alkaliphila]|uniref:Cell division protein ZapA n=1 Tax=Serpentinicella alkaliphila TaxID=1734049 RepID=A0A4V2T488_9FIRM|nr:cell division protein ZapA [Serpentinicella alkaliphila]QUH24415.1 cell division protein ZapA [Serpentinicella alkaliphila]TCQ04194.1 cell division protein ZapA [Serpentinicella alkaliphila]
MQTKNKVFVKINGQEYPIVGVEPKDYLIKVGTFVDDTMEFIAKTNKHLSTAMIAVLASINIADQFLKTTTELEKLQKEQSSPKEEVEGWKTHYKDIVKELEEKNEVCALLQRQVEDLLLYKEKTELENEELKETLKVKDDELNKADNIINELRNKVLDNQMKLVEAQNKLEDLINRNEQKNYYNNKNIKK